MYSLCTQRDLLVLASWLQGLKAFATMWGFPTLFRVWCGVHNRDSLCIPDSPRTCFVDQYDLEFRDLPSSVSQELLYYSFFISLLSIIMTWFFIPQMYSVSFAIHDVSTQRQCLLDSEIFFWFLLLYLTTYWVWFDVSI